MTDTRNLNGSNLVDRATKILKDPKAEWPVIETELTSTEQLYRTYIAPLAAIPAIAGFIGFSIVGVTLPFVGTYRYGMISGLAHMVVSWVLSMVMVYVAALIINKLAPTFESTPNEMQALKLVAYAYTPAWVAGAFMIIPALGLLAVLGSLYSIYLFYVGLPVMMKTPPAKVVPYMVVAAVVVIVMSILIAMIAAVMTGVGGAYRV